MVYGEYTEDWRFLDRALLSTQHIQAEANSAKQQQQKKGCPHKPRVSNTHQGCPTHTRGVHTYQGCPRIPGVSNTHQGCPHTPGFHLGGCPGISSNPPKPVYPSPPPLFIHNPNKNESGCVDFPFRTEN